MSNYLNRLVMKSTRQVGALQPRPVFRFESPLGNQTPRSTNWGDVSPGFEHSLPMPEGETTSHAFDIQLPTNLEGVSTETVQPSDRKTSPSGRSPFASSHSRTSLNPGSRRTTDQTSSFQHPAFGDSPSGSTVSDSQNNSLEPQPVSRLNQNANIIPSAARPLKQPVQTEIAPLSSAFSEPDADLISSMSLPRPDIARANASKDLSTVLKDPSLRLEPLAHSGLTMHPMTVKQPKPVGKTPAISNSSPVVQVNIGRIEIRATHPQPAKPRPRAATTQMSLAEYLRQRKAGER